MSSHQPFVDGLTIGEVLRHTVQQYPHQDALVFPARNYRASWAEFWQQVNAMAAGLLAMGLNKGDHVAIWATNVPEWVVLQFATARIGAVLVTINPAYRPFELKYVLNQCDAVALFLVDKFKTSDYFGMISEVCPELPQSVPGQLSATEFPRLRWVVATQGEPPNGCTSWATILELGKSIPQAEVETIAAQLRPLDPINIQYTSGTTGFPKAAMLSHRNLLMNAFYSGECQRLKSHDRICIPVPFYHCFGCVLGTLCASVYGAAMIVPHDYFQPAATLSAIHLEKATSLYGVPTMFISELEDPSFSQWDLSSLRTGIMAGSPCPIEVMRQVIERMGAQEITIGYGQTEASPVVTQTRHDDPLNLRIETVGRPIPGVEVKVIDSGGRELADNQQGELCSRGHVVMLGYYKNAEATAAAVDSDGWLHSGDLAVRLPNGYYKITGRIKDMVIRGGENIYPREIEEFLFQHPAIEQAAVVGVPDNKYGEELCAWIRLKQGQQCTEHEVREFCRQHLAHYKVPRYVRFVDAFPQTVTGKIQKFKIREQMIQELDLRVPETA